MKTSTKTLVAPRTVESTGKHRRTFIPATGHHWFLPLYDPIVKLLGIDRARRKLRDQAVLRPGHRILDIGCGTGSLVILIKSRHPDVDVVGLDPDSQALDRARRKAEKAGVSIQFDQGFSDELPYGDARFEHIFSSFMFHHLEPDQKDQTLREVRRVLKPGGSLHMLDFGGPEPRPNGLLARLLHFGHRLDDNFAGRILARMARAGLADVKEGNHRSKILGTIACYKATVPASDAGAS